MWRREEYLGSGLGLGELSKLTLAPPWRGEGRRDGGRDGYILKPSSQKAVGLNLSPIVPSFQGLVLVLPSLPGEYRVVYKGWWGSLTREAPVCSATYRYTLSLRGRPCSFYSCMLRNKLVHVVFGRAVRPFLSLREGL